MTTVPIPTKHPASSSATSDTVPTEAVRRAPSPLNGERAGVRGDESGAHADPRTVPAISPLLLRWFTWYCRGYLRRHFHSLRVSRAGLPPDTAGRPLVIYTNHASWWDPLVGLIIKDTFFTDRSLFVPIDAAMLERYRMFAKLGFFGVEQGSRRGAVQFLRQAEVVLDSPNHLLAVTPQSRFADVRERPVRFHAGLGHLAKRVERAVFLPMASEFVFWEERLPEILVRFGEPVEVRREHASAFPHDYWTGLFQEKLEETQNALAAEAQRRQPTEFQTLLRGGAGQGGVYDLWRALKARLRGHSFNQEHGTK
jgi:1-acyl-sn-glycerol-3-phosphate acyltransferase